MLRLLVTTFLPFTALPQPIVDLCTLCAEGAKRFAGLAPGEALKRALALIKADPTGSKLCPLSKQPVPGPSTPEPAMGEQASSLCRSRHTGAAVAAARLPNPPVLERPKADGLKWDALRAMIEVRSRSRGACLSRAKQDSKTGSLAPVIKAVGSGFSDSEVKSQSHRICVSNLTQWDSRC